MIYNYITIKIKTKVNIITIYINKLTDYLLDEVIIENFYISRLCALNTGIFYD